MAKSTKHTPYRGSPHMCTCCNSETGGRCMLHDPVTKHSPGRFVRANDETGLWEVRQGNCLIVALESESMAQELAAAPELLELLKHAVGERSELAVYLDDAVAPGIRAWFKSAIIAIAKAEGRPA